MKAKRLVAGVVSASMALSMLTVMPIMMTSAETQIENTFDRNYDGWYATNPAQQLIADASAAHDSARGMIVTERRSPEDGAESEKGYYIEGGIQYDYSVFVKADTDEHFKLKLTWRYQDDTTDSAIIGEVYGKAGEWEELRAEYEAPDDTVDLKLTLTTDTDNDFCFDEFKVVGQTPYHSDAEIQAFAANAGLKDMYANYFRVGTCMPNGALNNSTITSIVMKDFNSVTCENELKPWDTLVQNGSTDTNIKVSLNSASRIIDFCIQHNIAMRGHTFVWHSQTRSWFFRQGFNDNGNFVDKNTMNQRMESYIKNMFEAIETQYPDLNLYAYDVCNECVADGNSGGPRQAGDSNQQGGTSAWVSVYGDNSFIKQAFTYAKKYRPDGCKLFYNDYNEYETAKKNGILKILRDLKSDNLIDGMGMQSHITRQYTSLNQYVSALNEYADAVGCVHITELDIDGGDANFYQGIMQAAMERPEVEAFVVWGTTDNTSWRSGTNCLLFNGSGQPKEAYNKLAALVPESEWGDGDNPVGGGKEVKPIEPDADGCYFHNTFESGEEGWSKRGGATVSKTSGGFESSGALGVSGRTETWHGASTSLRSKIFKPGETYSFGAMVKYTTGEATEPIKMTLQYSLDGTDKYAEVATVTATKGEWTVLQNTSFTIPEGASSALLYVETPDEGGSLIDFYVDEAYGGLEGANPLKGNIVTTTTTMTTTTTTTTTTTSTTPQQVVVSKYGDTDCNGQVDVKDAVFLARVVANDRTADISDIGKANADVTKDGVVDKADLSKLLQFLAGQLQSL